MPSIALFCSGRSQRFETRARLEGERSRDTAPLDRSRGGPGEEGASRSLGSERGTVPARRPREAPRDSRSRRKSSSFSGSFRPWHGADLLVRAAARVLRESPRGLFPFHRRRSGVGRVARSREEVSESRRSSSLPGRSPTTRCPPVSEERLDRRRSLPAVAPRPDEARLLLVASQDLRVHGDGPARRRARRSAARRSRPAGAGGSPVPGRGRRGARRGDREAPRGSRACPGHGGSGPGARRRALQLAAPLRGAGPDSLAAWSRSDERAPDDRLVSAGRGRERAIDRGSRASSQPARASGSGRGGEARSLRAKRQVSGVDVAEVTIPASKLGNARERERAFARGMVLAAGEEAWDVAHAQHWLSAIATRRALPRLPTVVTVRDYWPVCIWSTRLSGNEPCPGCSYSRRVTCIGRHRPALWPVAAVLPPFVGRELARRTRALESASAVTAVSGYVAGTLPLERVAVIPNFVEPLEKDPPRPADVPDRYVLFVGKLEPGKAPDLLAPILEAARIGDSASRRWNGKARTGAEGAGRKRSLPRMGRGRAGARAHPARGLPALSLAVAGAALARAARRSRARRGHRRRADRGNGRDDRRWGERSPRARRGRARAGPSARSRRASSRAATSRGGAEAGGHGFFGSRRSPPDRGPLPKRRRRHESRAPLACGLSSPRLWRPRAPRRGAREVSSPRRMRRDSLYVAAHIGAARSSARAHGLRSLSDDSLAAAKGFRHPRPRHQLPRLEPSRGAASALGRSGPTSSRPTAAPVSATRSRRERSLRRSSCILTEWRSSRPRARSARSIFRCAPPFGSPPAARPGSSRPMPP